MGEYGFLAQSYDELTRDVDYRRWADYIEMHVKNNRRAVHSVLDLACGTGTLSWMLAQRGYEVTGVDSSGDMLTQAEGKREAYRGVKAPLFLCQRMERLRLHGTVDACICCLDSVNHVVKPARLKRAFERVFHHLAPGGLFLFDINTPEYLEGIDGGIFLDESEDVYCVWRADFSKKRNICTFGMDIFRREGEQWRREREVHEEFAYTPGQLCGLLEETGFSRIRQFGHLKRRGPKPGEARIFFTAGKDR